MENKFAVSAGVWKLEQDSSTLELTLFKFGREVQKWQENRIFTWQELYFRLLHESFERRGEK